MGKRCWHGEGMGQQETLLIESIQQSPEGREERGPSQSQSGNSPATAGGAKTLKQKRAKEDNLLWL